MLQFVDAHTKLFAFLRVTSHCVNEDTFSCTPRPWRVYIDSEGSLFVQFGWRSRGWAQPRRPFLQWSSLKRKWSCVPRTFRNCFERRPLGIVFCPSTFILSTHQRATDTRLLKERACDAQQFNRGIGDEAENLSLPGSGDAVRTKTRTRTQPVTRKSLKRSTASRDKTAPPHSSQRSPRKTRTEPETHSVTALPSLLDLPFSTLSASSYLNFLFIPCISSALPCVSSLSQPLRQLSSYMALLGSAALSLFQHSFMLMLHNPFCAMKPQTSNCALSLLQSVFVTLRFSLDFPCFGVSVRHLYFF